MKKLRMVFIVLGIIGFLLSTAFIIYLAIDLFYQNDPNTEGLDFIVLLLISLGYGGLFYGISALFGLIALIISIVLRKKGEMVGRALPITTLILPIAAFSILTAILTVIGHIGG